MLFECIEINMHSIESTKRRQIIALIILFGIFMKKNNLNILGIKKKEEFYMIQTTFSDENNRPFLWSFISKKRLKILGVFY